MPRKPLAVWLDNGMVRQWLDSRRLICRRPGQTGDMQWWARDTEMGRMSLSVRSCCRWRPLSRKKRLRVRKHVDPEASREGTESKPLFLISLKPNGRQRAASTNFPWTGVSAEWVEPLPLIYRSQTQSLWPSSCPVWSCIRQRRRATWISGTVFFKVGGCHGMSSGNRALQQHVSHFGSL